MYNTSKHAPPCGLKPGGEGAEGLDFVGGLEGAGGLDFAGGPEGAGIPEGAQAQAQAQAQEPWLDGQCRSTVDGVV